MMVKKKILSRRSNSKQLLLVGLIVCMTLFLVNVISAFDWTTNIQTYLKMDDDSPSTVIINEIGTNGVLNGTNTEDISVAGIINKSLNFDGTNDYGFLTDQVGSNKDLSVSFWVDIDTFQLHDNLFKLRNLENAWIDINIDGTEYITGSIRQADGLYTLFMTSSADTYTPVDISGAGYHHIVMTLDYSSKTLNLYVDNQLHSSDTNTNFVGTASTFYNGTYLMGHPELSWQGDGEKYTDGKMDELGIWNRTLSESEITELYNSGNGLPYFYRSKITLESPVNEIILSDLNINFTASGNDIPTPNWEWKNITYYVWNTTGLFNSTSINIVDAVTFNNSLQINDFSIGNYEWNVYCCYGNATFNNCTFSESNFTFEWRPFEIISQSHNEYVYETDSQGFNLNINTLPEVLSVSSKLIIMEHCMMQQHLAPLGFVIFILI